jgi:F-type H+-transporting ATPase subunit a
MWEEFRMFRDRYLPQILFQFGPIQISSTVVYSLLASVVLVGLAFSIRGHLDRPTGWRLGLEMLMEELEGMMREMLSCDPRAYTPLVVTLAFFIGLCNLMGQVPGLHAPTADLSTAAALAVVVFFAVPFYGIRARGVRGYLGHYLEPAPFLLPIEIVTELSRTLTLAVRLFGNVMSEQLVVGVLLLLAGLLVPVPIMLLSVLTSVIQAYIFAVLTVVYLGAAIRSQSEQGRQT